MHYQYVVELCMCPGYFLCDIANSCLPLTILIIPFCLLYFREKYLLPWSQNTTLMMSASIPTQVCSCSHGSFSETNLGYALLGFKFIYFLRQGLACSGQFLVGVFTRRIEQEVVWVTQKMTLFVTQFSASLAVNRNQDLSIGRWEMRCHFNMLFGSFMWLVIVIKVGDLEKAGVAW